MKKRYIYIATLALFLGACSDNELEQTYTSEQNTEIYIPADAQPGELIIKFLSLIHISEPTRPY